MTDVRVSAATGLSTDWASSPLVLGMGQLAWETDTQILRIGDGVNLEPQLPILAQNSTNPVVTIDDSSTGQGNSVWSSLQTSTQIAAALAAANAYTDKVAGGFTQRVDVAVQNADSTWPVRPSAYVVFAFGISGALTPPSWMGPYDIFMARP